MRRLSTLTLLRDLQSSGSYHQGFAPLTEYIPDRSLLRDPVEAIIFCVDQSGVIRKDLEPPLGGRG